LKILFYINRLGLAGAQKVICNLANAFCREDEIIFVTSYQGTEGFALDKRITRINLGETRETNVLIKNLHLLVRLHSILKQSKPDVAVSFMAEPNLRLILSSLFLPNKVVVSVRNDPVREYHGKVRKFLARFIFRFADGHVFQTEDACKFFPARIRQNSIVILNSVDGHFFQNPPNHTKDIVNVGRLEPQKNQLLLVNAFALIAHEFPNQNLHFYGEGHRYDTLNNRIQQLGLTDRIFIHSPQKDIYNYIGSYRLFVLSSDYEGLPNALMEAMAMGIPCISTDCPCGGPKVLLPAKQLVPVGSVQQLAAKIKEMLSIENMSMIIQEEKSTAMNFTPQKVNAIWHEYLSDVVKK
jgi:glycosyltransferase involved in cell wall biosynthesis